MSMHSGHRGRLKGQFLDHGLDTMADHQVLELLLFYAIPRTDTNPIAHALMDRFGSLSAVLEASPAELTEVKGVGEHAATLLHLITAAARRYELDKVSGMTILDTTESIGRYMAPLFYGLADEAVYVVYLDGKGKVIYRQHMADGSVNSVSFSIRAVTETALKRKATSVVLAHNHPSDFAIPGMDDLEATRALVQSLATVGIRLRDHIVVGLGDFVSMRDSGHLAGIEKRLGFFQNPSE